MLASQRLALALALLLAPSLPGTARAADEPKAKVDLSPLILQTDLLQLSGDDFMAKWEKPGRFRWVSNERKTARSDSDELVLAEQPLVEALFEFGTDGKIAGATLALYTRGDAGSLTETAFGEKIKTSVETCKTLLKTEPALNRGDNTRAVNVQSATWKTESATYTLEWSFSREMRSRGIPFRGEFVRLRVDPPERQVGMLERSLAERDQKNAPTKVERKATRNDKGDVVLESVPMVDQGQKGYCVVAAAERVLRFYNREVDQHELASIANSSAAQGTTPEAMVSALKTLTQRFKVRVRTHFEWDVRGFIGMIEDYNRAARRAKQPDIRYGQMIDLVEVYTAMNPEVLKETRLKEKADLGKFQRDIKAKIDEGVPLLWSVILGIYPETQAPVQGTGGHMRLIIGYNESTREVLYSDSWGSGHELKRMSLDDAWAKTTGLYSIESF